MCVCVYVCVCVCAVAPQAEVMPKEFLSNMSCTLMLPLWSLECDALHSSSPWAGGAFRVEKLWGKEKHVQRSVRKRGRGREGGMEWCVIWGDSVANCRRGASWWRLLWLLESLLFMTGYYCDWKREAVPAWLWARRPWRWRRRHLKPVASTEMHHSNELLPKWRAAASHDMSDATNLTAPG